MPGLAVQLVVGIYCLLMLACHIQNESIDDIVVAEVANKKLMASELNNIIHPTANTYDSTALANAYIDQWVRDQLLMREAAKYFSSDVNIEKLVDDYRGKLIMINMENRILAERFDTTVTNLDIQSFYEENRQQFILDHTIFRCAFVQLPNSWEGLRDFRREWSRSDTPVRIQDIEANAREYHLELDKWLNWEQIAAWSDLFSFEDAIRKKDISKSDDNFEYFLKILEIKDEKDISPLSYIQYQLKLMILHNRKQKIIEDYKQELYEKALESNLIKL